jgi:hypothetical protein
VGGRRKENKEEKWSRFHVADPRPPTGFPLIKTFIRMKNPKDDIGNEHL